MRDTSNKKKIMVFAYLFIEFFDIKVFSDDNLLLLLIITLQDLHGIYQN